jgi:hypothetical protein
MELEHAQITQSEFNRAQAVANQQFPELHLTSEEIWNHREFLISDDRIAVLTTIELIKTERCRLGGLKPPGLLSW